MMNGSDSLSNIQEGETYTGASVVSESDCEANHGGVTSPFNDECLSSKEHRFSTPSSDTSTPYIMSDASRVFDRDNKGFLDSTERALRTMDTDNDGKLSIDTLYDMMRSLQDAQKLSNDLVQSLEKEKKTSLNLKKAVIGLAVFALLLSLANIGTSFAAARLAKDTYIVNGDMVSKSSNERIGTTSKVTEVQMKPLTSSGRRRLESFGLDWCTDVFNYTGTSFQYCREDGVIEYDEAANLYALLCPALGVPGSGPCPSLKNAVDKVYLTCQETPNTIFGGAELPMMGPKVIENGIYGTYTTFPAVRDYRRPDKPYKYEGLQYVADPDGGLCAQNFEASMTCPNGAGECFIFTILLEPFCAVFDEEVGGDPDLFSLCWMNDEQEL